jgi:hypothetical protein
MILVFYFLGFLAKYNYTQDSEWNEVYKKKESGELIDHYTFQCDTNSWLRSYSNVPCFSLTIY